LNDDIPAPEVAEGDGVVTCGGGKYWPGVVVSVRMLREVSDLPVQVWHRGGDEPIEPADLDGVPGVTFHDATAYPHRRLRGWETKTQALVHCGLRRALFLDADAYCVSDPRPLLDLASQHRFVSWSDMAGQDKNMVWSAFGLSHSVCSRTPTIQGGQLAIDLVLARRELVVAHWLNQHSDYSYHFGFGDQDMWRVAFAATGGSRIDLGEPPWDDVAFICSLQGVPVAVHRCQSKMLRGESPKRNNRLPKESKAFGYFHDWLAKHETAAEVFGKIYQGGLWGPPGDSGLGSSDAQAAPYLEIIDRLIVENDWRSVVDLCCGDGRITKQIVANFIAAVDVHAPHIARLAAERPDIDWRCLDIDRDRDKLPSGGVALVKDVLHHFGEALTRDWLNWARTCGKWGAVVITNDHDQYLPDCRLGGWRGLDPAKPPLSEVAGLRKVTSYLGKTVMILECAS
jgi:SAM-dependent methyltransferase